MQTNWTTIPFEGPIKQTAWGSRRTTCPTCADVIIRKVSSEDPGGLRARTLRFIEEKNDDVMEGAMGRLSNSGERVSEGEGGGW